MHAKDCDWMTNHIVYGRSEDLFRVYKQLIMELIQQNNIRRVCDIGGGANPLLNADYIHQSGIDYSILDISETELAKASIDCTKIQADIASHDFPIDSKFDLVFSKMLAEHIPDAEQFHKNVLRILAEGGIAVHFFPTLYSLPFLVNYLVPEYLADVLLEIISPRDKHQHAKFPAYYRWCRGPIRSQVKRFSDLGYDIVEYRGLFGHGYYKKIKILDKIHDLKTKYLLQHSNPFLTSYAYVVLKNAGRSAAPDRALGLST
jgi:SAM-dependent methyltransferase